jgi:hypothetical protein
MSAAGCTRPNGRVRPATCPHVFIPLPPQSEAVRALQRVASWPLHSFLALAFVRRRLYGSPRVGPSGRRNEAQASLAWAWILPRDPILAVDVEVDGSAGSACATLSGVLDPQRATRFALASAPSEPDAGGRTS